PKVAFRSPPTPGPASLPNSSVASPRNQASGTIAIPATANTTTPGPRTTSRIQLTGTDTPRRPAQVSGRSGPPASAPGNVGPGGAGRTRRDKRGPNPRARKCAQERRGSDRPDQYFGNWS